MATTPKQTKSSLTGTEPWQKGRMSANFELHDCSKLQFHMRMGPYAVHRNTIILNHYKNQRKFIEYFVIFFTLFTARKILPHSFYAFTNTVSGLHTKYLLLFLRLL